MRHYGGPECSPSDKDFAIVLPFLGYLLRKLPGKLYCAKYGASPDETFEPAPRPPRLPRAKLAPMSEPHLHFGWEVVCPDDRVRHYPYFNRDDADSAAKLSTERQCRL